VDRGILGPRGPFVLFCTTLYSLFSGFSTTRAVVTQRRCDGWPHVMRSRVASLQPHLPDRHRVDYRDWRAARMLLALWGGCFTCHRLLKSSKHAHMQHAMPQLLPTPRFEAPRISTLHVPSEPSRPASDDHDNVTLPASHGVRPIHHERTIIHRTRQHVSKTGGLSDKPCPRRHRISDPVMSLPCI
jgi:hypothetical protein